MTSASVVLLSACLLVSCAVGTGGDEDPDVPEDQDVQKLQQVGAEYLQNVMNQLQNDRAEGHTVEMSELANIINTERVSEAAPGKGKQSTSAPKYVISGPTPAPPLAAEVIQAAPPPALTSEELAAIYKAALTKGASMPQLQVASKPISHFHHPPPPPPLDGVQPASQGPTGDAFPGYYYYFYPIKSFLKTPEPTTTTMKPQMPVIMMPPPNKGMEPLFMAISGFIGMAMMFIFSVLFLPKFGKFRSDDISKLKEAPEELAAFGKIFIETMDGKDCSERMACEIGRILRRVKMDNKPLRILEIVLPPYMSKQILQVRKAAARKEKCNFIPCKFKTSRPAKTNKQKLSQLSQHELWMKHFQQQKLTLKQPENIWHRDHR